MRPIGAIRTSNVPKTTQETARIDRLHPKTAEAPVGQMFPEDPLSPEAIDPITTAPIIAALIIAVPGLREILAAPTVSPIRTDGPIRAKVITIPAMGVPIGK